jgi:uroporphyrinogen decarboxylase
MDADEIKALYSKTQSYENLEIPKGEMSPRERFFNVMNFKKTDRIIDMEFGYWNDTLRRWHKEGLPSYVNNNDIADVYFGFDNWRKHIPTSMDILPGFKQVVLEDDGRHQIILNSDRVKCEIFTDGKDTIPHYIDFPIKDHESYLPFKERLKFDAASRIHTNLIKTGEQVKNRNYVLCTYGGSTAGIIRNWMGFEGICMNLYDQPELLDEILEDLGTLYCDVASAITEHVDIDLISWWEDIAFKNGPIVTPDFFNIKCGRIIKKVMDIYRGHGTHFGFVDCDGDFRLLMPGWLNNGVNIMFPLEVAAGIHPDKLRRENPGIRMMGGVDKVVLLQGREAIKKELLKLKPLVEEGGFIPHVDHRVQADVPYKNYLDYLELKRELFGIPNQIRR